KFADLKPGTYYIDVSSGDLYEPATERVFLNRESIMVSIYVREKGAPASEKPAGATVSAEEFDRKAPASAKKEYDKAAKLIADGNAEKAIEHLRSSLAIYPDYLMARNQLGVQCLKLKRLAEAAEQFELALSKAPKFFNARFNLGLVRMEERDYKSAIQ